MMNYWKLLLRSLGFYRKTHLWVVLGTMISTSILVGALIIGDSVKFSLRQIVFARLGNTEFALTSGDRFFRTQIADDLSKIIDNKVAPLLQTKGIAIADGGQRRLNNIQIIGVDNRFGEIVGIKDFYNNISPDEAIINQHLAAHLQLKKGDEFLLRIKKLDMIPKDIPLALDTDLTIAKPLKVRAIASDAQFGRFNLKADQVAPNTVFVSLFSLSKQMGYNNRVNVLLMQKLLRGAGRRRLNEAFKKTWTLADIALEVRELPGRNMIEIKSNRIFLDPWIADAALNINKNAQPVFTYFVNEIALGNKSTPYSFVSAPGTSFLPADMKDDEIIINEWLARDLDANKGDQIRLTYYVLGPMRDLTEESADFRVKAIVPLKIPYVDRDLMPDFPGLSAEQNCRDWDPGIPIDLDRIREKDEDYWDNYRGTPKAFVTINAAQKMWRNRFGNLTAVRFPGLEKKEIEKKLIGELDPVNFGFVFREVREEGLRASAQSVDFGQLFLGLSFFIIIAALLLTGLLYVFNVERRSQENGLFLALGFPGKNVRRLVLMEGAVIIIIGSLLGSAAGVLYNQVILYALKTVWHGAVGTSMLQIHLKFSTILTGTAIGVFIAFFTIWLVTRKQFKQPISGLQKGLTKLEVYRGKRPRVSMLIGISGVIAVIIVLVTTKFETGREAFMFFFMAGTLLLVSGMAFIKVLLYKLRINANTGKLSLSGIGVRNNIRRPVRSLTLIGLLACGVFIVFTVGANRVISTKDAEKRESGTGGFALYGESSIPVLYDLNREKGTRFYGLESINAKEVSYVQFRVKEGDDASCLNLNRVSNPQLIGVNPDELTRRAAFTFVEKTNEVDPESPWGVLKQNLSDGTIPAVADQTVILWGLGKAVGDTLSYMDETGKTFKIKLVGGLANSIFQGSIIVSEKALIQKYPSISGYRLFLIDAPFENLEEISKDLSRAMEDQGLDLAPAAARLAEFNQVENTYLSIFLILGSFGLILGSIGLGIVVWRNVKERQGELALLRAVGFYRKSIQKMVLFEHIALLTAGIVCGIAAALLATLPSIMTPGSGIPYVTIILLLIIVMINGVGWTYFATRTAARGDLLASLRNE
ncbi:MAG: FtsX-like permease family protein [Candidatus Aminicenantes bacterium]|nr:FtsX-like permease family protein [Candidatus Aminicenantes bacterium]NIM84871.1 FtsX-like permease family protein [Candidatus Aminicenantes bacterium]NIN24379.1 FtsX-like permease family protein [Candidatus Aminicenantes bacterium]NIN48143.1 FtsX-like permease family protein [Candidatus Aminicenantes bacterium]NIN91046.1 FtsX-like permease family protein [Candidatus Aminicenantes bacterium]